MKIFTRDLDFVKFNGSEMEWVKFNGATVYEAWRELTKSGVPPITLEKCKGVDLIDYKIYGNSVQNGDPTPENWVKVEHFGNITKNLVDFSINNLESLKYNNNASGNTRYGVDMGVLPPGDYTFSFDLVNDNEVPTYVYIRRKNSEGGFSTVVNMTTGTLQTKEHTFEADGTSNYYLFLASATFDTLEKATAQWIKMKNIMLEPGVERTNYVPHCELPIFVKDENGEIKGYSIFFNTPLRKINEHSDYIDFKNKKIVRNITRMKIRNMGFALLSSGSYYRFETTATSTVQNTKLFTGEDSKNVLCESLYPDVYTGGGDDGISERTSHNYLKIRTQKYATVSELDDGIGDSNVYFVLKKPDEEDIELPNILLNKGTNIIEMYVELLPSNMEVEYMGKE